VGTRSENRMAQKPCIYTGIRGFMGLKRIRILVIGSALWHLRYHGEKKCLRTSNTRHTWLPGSLFRQGESSCAIRHMKPRFCSKERKAYGLTSATPWKHKYRLMKLRGKVLNESLSILPASLSPPIRAPSLPDCHLREPE
jgi:hypothetical protein